MAKGISILGVVLLHITLKVPDSQNTWLAHFNVWLDPLRLPLFFLVSGYFSTKVRTYTFGQLFSRRLWYFLVPYAIWMLVEQHTNRIEYHWVFGDPLYDWGQIFASMLVGHSMAWFLHSLIVFNVFLWCVRTMPGWAAVLLSFLPLVLMAWQAQFTAIAKAVMFLPIFVAAAFFREWITEFADAIERPLKGVWDSRAFWAYSGMLVCYCGGFFIRNAWNNYTGDVHVPWPFMGAESLVHDDVHIVVRFVEQALEAPLGIACAVVISHVPGLSRAVRFVGAHTLPIYLGHPIGLTLMFGFYIAKHPRPISLQGTWPLENTWFWLSMCVIFAAIASLALWGIEKIPVLGWSVKPPSIARFFEPPAPVQPTARNKSAAPRPPSPAPTMLPTQREQG